MSNPEYDYLFKVDACVVVHFRATVFVVFRLMRKSWNRVGLTSERMLIDRRWTERRGDGEESVE